MKWLRWCAVYVAMWMVISMLMTRMYHWPKEYEMTPYGRTGPGQIATLIGSSLPSALTGMVLGPVGPLLFASQQGALAYGREFDAAQKNHPGWTNVQRNNKGTASMKEGTVIIARIVPFLNGWMITTEVVVSFSGDAVREQLQKSYGVTIPQFTFVQKYHEDRKRRMG
jgi:hypothetical protein